MRGTRWTNRGRGVNAGPKRIQSERMNITFHMIVERNFHSGMFSRRAFRTVSTISTLSISVAPTVIATATATASGAGCGPSSSAGLNKARSKVMGALTITTMSRTSLSRPSRSFRFWKI